MKKTSKKTKKKCVGPAAKRSANSPRFILLGSSVVLSNQFPKQHSVTCRSLAHINQAVHTASRDSIWIASRSVMIDQLIQVVSRNTAARSGNRGRIGKLLILELPRPTAIRILQSYFEPIVGADSFFKLLPGEQLAEVLSAPKDEARDLFIGGFVDIQSEIMVLFRGDFSRLIVPFSIFRASGTSDPDFHRFSVDDYGQTVRLGDYEAGADFVLYALDSEYRTRINARRREWEKGFGPSLRRLRNLRKLGRDSFGEVAAKTIARIERGEVQTPRGRTLQVICETLTVDPEEIESY